MHMVFPAPGVDLSKPEDSASIGMTVTKMSALHAIRSVLADRRPGSSPAPTSRCAFAGRFTL